MIEAVLGGALITALAGLLGIVLNRLRCRILVSDKGGWSCGAGFSEVKLQMPGGGGAEGG